MPDIPLDNAVSKAIEVIQSGGMVWQKFTCMHCGTRQTIETPNAFYTHGTCEECGKDTCIHKRGCGLMVAMSVPVEYTKELITNGHGAVEK